MRLFSGILVFLSTLACQNHSSGREPIFDHDNIPAVASKSDRPWPGERVLPEGTYYHFRDAGTFQDLLTIEHLVPLAFTADPVMGEVTDLAFFDGHWFVLDKTTPAVFKYTGNGSWVTYFGRGGEGPGEFQLPMLLRPAFDGLLSVGDPMQGKIHLFRADGTYLRATDPDIGQRRIMARFGYIWDQPDRLYVAAFSSQNEGAPQHVVLDYSSGEGSVLFGFGQRNKAVFQARQRGSGTLPYGAFARIGQTIWTGSPFTTYLEIYDLDGRFLGNLGKEVPRHPESAVTQEDLEQLAREQKPELKMRKLALKAANHKIGRLGDVVVVQLGSFLDFYDRSGNLLKGNLPFLPLSNVFFTNDRLVMIFDPKVAILENRPEIANALDGMEISEDVGWVLVVYKIREALFQ